MYMKIKMLDGITIQGWEKRVGRVGVSPPRLWQKRRRCRQRRRAALLLAHSDFQTVRHPCSIIIHCSASFQLANLFLADYANWSQSSLTFDVQYKLTSKVKAPLGLEPNFITFEEKIGSMYNLSRKTILKTLILVSLNLV